jgi:hypothetical protein
LQFVNIFGHGGQDFDKPNYRWKWDLAIPVNDVKQLFGKKILLYNIQDGDGNKNHEANWLIRQRVEPKGGDEN